jgi:formate dehydrogenase iron-sulfur subunit
MSAWKAEENTMSTSPITLYIPRDAAALSVGAERVVKAIADEAKKRGVDIKIIRNGSRGMLWLEPLVEVVTTKGRVAYGPVTPKDVSSLFDAKFFEGGAHALGHGLTEEIPFFKNQERLTFQRVGVIDPLSLEESARDDRRGHCAIHYRFRFAWSRWRRFSDRHQMEDRSQYA